MKSVVGAILAALVIVAFAPQAAASSVAVAGTAAEPAAPTYPSLRAAFDNVGVSDDGDPGAGDLDGAGRSLSEQALAAAGWSRGARVTVDGTAFTWPDVPRGRPDNVVANGQTIALRGTGRALSFLVTGTGGDTAAQGTITYAGGRRQQFELTAPDWAEGLPSVKAVAVPYRNTGGGPESVPAKIYPVTVPLDPRQPVRSVTLPATGPVPGAAVHVFALGIRPGGWTASWTASTSSLFTVGPWTQQTRRMVVHTSTGGRRARIRLENTFADRPAVIGRTTIAVQGAGAAAAGRPAGVTFGGRSSVTIPAGGEAISDPVRFTVPADRNLLVSLYLPGPVEAAPVHALETQTSYATPVGGGDHAADTGGTAFTETYGYWNLLTGVDVSEDQGTVVALGNSITDGVGSTRDANLRWTNQLAARLLAQDKVPHYGVANAGISGNKVVSDRYDGDGPSTDGRGVSALHRLDRDVFAQPGARTVIFFEGINDLRGTTSADELIAGYRQIAARARAHGLRVIVGTITPCKGWSDCTPEVDAKRTAVNEFIRASADATRLASAGTGASAAGEFDAVVDFDAVLRDPADPARFLPAYDSGDHLHPGDVGYRAMAEAVDLSLLG